MILTMWNRNVALASSLLCSVALAVLAPVEAAHAQQKPKPLIRDAMEEITATVESIDRGERALVLVGPQGKRVLVVAGPQVRNFDRIKVGDRLNVGFYAGIAIAVKPRGPEAAGTERVVVSKQAPAGQSPAGGVSHSVATSVKIDSVDTSFNTVTFTRQDGIVRTLAVEDPQAQDFIRRLKSGDEVEILYTEAIAVLLQPASAQMP